MKEIALKFGFSENILLKIEKHNHKLKKNYTSFYDENN